MSVLPDLAAEPRPKFKRRMWLLFVASQPEFPSALENLAKNVLQAINNQIGDYNRKGTPREHHEQNVMRAFTAFSEAHTLWRG